MDKEGLTKRIEKLYSHVVNETDPEKKKRWETLVRHYANKYHDLTGDWYRRSYDHLWSKRSKRSFERVDVGNDYQI